MASPLCDKCGMVCIVCSVCQAEFICSCDNPPHHCQIEIKGVAGNPLGLYLKLLNLDGVGKIFDAGASLDIIEEGKPILKGWHMYKEGDDKDENQFQYIDNCWIIIYPDYNDTYDDFRNDNIELDCYPEVEE